MPIKFSLSELKRTIYISWIEDQQLFLKLNEAMSILEQKYSALFLNDTANVRIYFLGLDVDFDNSLKSKSLDTLERICIEIKADQNPRKWAERCILNYEKNHG